MFYKVAIQFFFMATVCSRHADNNLQRNYNYSNSDVEQIGHKEFKTENITSKSKEIEDNSKEDNANMINFDHTKFQRHHKPEDVGIAPGPLIDSYCALNITKCKSQFPQAAVRRAVASVGARLLAEPRVCTDSRAAARGCSWDFLLSVTVFRIFSTKVILII